MSNKIAKAVTATLVALGVILGALAPAAEASTPELIEVVEIDEGVEAIEITEIDNGGDAIEISVKCAKKTKKVAKLQGKKKTKKNKAKLRQAKRQMRKACR